MELLSLGAYRLGQPIPVATPNSRLFLARPEEMPDDPPRFLAKLKLPGSGPLADVARAQFEHEIALLRRLNHPSIPSAHADGLQDGVRYVVMDYVDGVDLATLLGHRAGRPVALTPEQSVYVLAQVADALHHLHDLVHEADDGYDHPLGALHRDLCPSNIYVSRDGDVFLGDFGSASSALLADEHDARNAGHVAYCAPERITGSGQASVQSDLFALAVVLWEMLKGQRCFRAENDLKTLDAISRFDIAHASRRVSGLSPRLSEVLRRNLDRDPARRFDTAHRVLQRLSQAPEAAGAEQARLDLMAMVRAVASSPPGV
jgi:serine/threonine-protein kinase